MPSTQSLEKRGGPPRFDGPAPKNKRSGRPNLEVRATIDPNLPVSELEYRLCQEIAAGNSIWVSAVRAGYENTPSLSKNIYAIVAKPNVQRVLAEQRELTRQATMFTRERAQEMLQEGYDMGRLMAEPMAMVGAVREMIKMHGYNAPIKHEMNITGNVEVAQLNRLSDQELLQLMSKAKKEQEQLQIANKALDNSVEDATPKE